MAEIKRDYKEEETRSYQWLYDYVVTRAEILAGFVGKKSKKKSDKIKRKK